jgi:hypothetical protein
MSSSGVQLATSVGIALAVTWTMLFAGTRKRMLAMRTRRRRCPSCGHVMSGRVCNRH